MKRVHSDWYLGTADAVQNLESILEEQPDSTLILAADRIYKMNYREMIARRHSRGAKIIVATIRVPRKEARSFAVVAVDSEDRVEAVEEKPQQVIPTLYAATQILLMSPWEFFYSTRMF